MGMDVGKCSAWAMELHKCGALNASLTAGCKVLLTDPVVHGGLLMLMGASVRVLGGGVDRLESARKRLLEHWNQPLGCSLLSVQVRTIVDAYATFCVLEVLAVEADRQGRCAGTPQCGTDDA